MKVGPSASIRSAIGPKHSNPNTSSFVRASAHETINSAAIAIKTSSVEPATASAMICLSFRGTASKDVQQRFHAISSSGVLCKTPSSSRN
jgi:hypothetical protein